jgi:hypothetical protein
MYVFNQYLYTAYVVSPLHSRYLMPAPLSHKPYSPSLVSVGL